MAKVTVRKKVSQLGQEKLVELVMDLYKLKDSKLYLDSLFDPHFEKDYEVAVGKIYKLFERPKDRKTLNAFLKLKKLWKNSKRLFPPVEYMASLLLYVPQVSARFAKESSVCSGAYKALLANHLRYALEFINECRKPVGL